MTTEPKKPITHSTLRNESTPAIQPAPPPERSNAADSVGGHPGSNPTSNRALQVAPALPPAFPPPKEPFARGKLRMSASRQGR